MRAQGVDEDYRWDNFEICTVCATLFSLAKMAENLSVSQRNMLMEWLFAIADNKRKYHSLVRKEAILALAKILNWHEEVRREELNKARAVFTRVWNDPEESFRMHAWSQYILGWILGVERLQEMRNNHQASSSMAASAELEKVVKDILSLLKENKAPPQAPDEALQAYLEKSPQSLSEPRHIQLLRNIVSPELSSEEKNYKIHTLMQEFGLEKDPFVLLAYYQEILAFYQKFIPAFNQKIEAAIEALRSGNTTPKEYIQRIIKAVKMLEKGYKEIEGYFALNFSNEIGKEWFALALQWLRFGLNTYFVNISIAEKKEVKEMALSYPLVSLLKDVTLTQNDHKVWIFDVKAMREKDENSCSPVGKSANSLKKEDEKIEPAPFARKVSSSTSSSLEEEKGFGYRVVNHCFGRGSWGDNRKSGMNYSCEVVESSFLPIIEQIKRHFPQFIGVRLLEIGCGTGNLLKYLENRGMHIRGIDNDANTVAIARQKVKKVFFLKKISGIRKALRGEVFDVIISSFLLQKPTLTDTEIGDVVRYTNALLREGGVHIHAAAHTIPLKHFHSQGITLVTDISGKSQIYPYYHLVVGTKHSKRISSSVIAQEAQNADMALEMRENSSLPASDAGSTLEENEPVPFFTLKEAIESDFNKTIDPNLKKVTVQKIYRIVSNIAKEEIDMQSLMVERENPLKELQWGSVNVITRFIMHSLKYFVDNGNTINEDRCRGGGVRWLRRLLNNRNLSIVVKSAEGQKKGQSRIIRPTLVHGEHLGFGEKNSVDMALNILEMAGGITKRKKQGTLISLLFAPVKEGEEAMPYLPDDYMLKIVLNKHFVDIDLDAIIEKSLDRNYGKLNVRRMVKLLADEFRKRGKGPKDIKVMSLYRDRHEDLFEAFKENGFTVLTKDFKKLGGYVRESEGRYTDGNIIWRENDDWSDGLALALEEIDLIIGAGGMSEAINIAAIVSKLGGELRGIAIASEYMPHGEALRHFDHIWNFSPSETRRHKRFGLNPRQIFTEDTLLKGNPNESVLVIGIIRDYPWLAGKIDGVMINPDTGKATVNVIWMAGVDTIYLLEIEVDTSIAEYFTQAAGAKTLDGKVSALYALSLAYAEFGLWKKARVSIAEALQVCKQHALEELWMITAAGEYMREIG